MDVIKRNFYFIEIVLDHSKIPYFNVPNLKVYIKFIFSEITDLECELMHKKYSPLFKNKNIKTILYYIKILF